MQGRNSKSLTEKNIAGTLQACRVSQQVPTQKLQALPRPPRFLSKVARKMYFSKGQELISEGVLSSLDLELFLSFCIESSKYFDLTERIEKIDPDKNRSTLKMLLQMQNSSFVRMSYLAGQFGLSPLARQKFIKNIVDPDQLALELAFENL